MADAKIITIIIFSLLFLAFGDLHLWANNDDDDNNNNDNDDDLGRRISELGPGPRDQLPLTKDFDFDAALQCCSAN